MKKFLIFIISSIIFLSSVFCVTAGASYNSLTETLSLHSENYFFMSLDNDTVIFEKNADKQLLPASLTKIVTATVVLENCGDLSAVVTAPAYCIEMLNGTGSSTAGIKDGEQLSVDDLLHYLLIESANDAALILADYVCNGDIDAFIKLMNEVVEKAGCTNTNFVNPHGLDDEYQFSTPRDMAKLMKYAVQNSHFKNIISLKSYTIPASNLRKAQTILNTNKTLNATYTDYYSKYIVGGKTGSTSKAGKCLATISSNNGYNYVCVIMNAPQYNIDDDRAEENCAFVDTRIMTDWAMKNLELVKIADTANVAAEVPVRLSFTADYVTLCPSEDKYELVPTGTNEGNVEIKPVDGTVPEVLTAPVKKGDVICKANVLYGGEPIAEIELVASNDMRRSVILSVLDVLSRVFSSLPMKLLGAAVLIFIVVLVCLRIRSIMRKRKRDSLHIVSDNTRQNMR